MSGRVLIVGAGPAGLNCAAGLAEGGFGGEIVLAGREPDPPYDRPPISKGYLAGRVGRDDVALDVPAGVDLRVRTSVMKADLERRVATLATKEELEFESLVVATGANVRRLRVDGAMLEGIHYLRALGNADALRADVGEGARVVLVGGSYIACEVAATLTGLGARCTMVMLEDAPLSTGFGATLGGWAAELLQAHGVELVCGDGLEAFIGDERVAGVRTASGRVVDADVVVMGTGAMPDVMLARSAGLELGPSGGVRCSASLQASADGVWCAGDACEYDSVLHGRPVRIEHWEVASAQGRHVARAILGDASPYREVPYFWSDLADWATVEYVGLGATGDREEVEGEVKPGEAFTVTHFDGDRMVGRLSVGVSGAIDDARERIAAQA